MIPSPAASSRTPFVLVPWDTDFLSRLAAGLIHATANQPGKALVIFPHDRAARYLMHHVQHNPEWPRPCVPPRLLTISEVFSTLRAEIDDGPFPVMAQLPDQIALMARCAREAAVPGSALCERLAQMDEAAFFPWGARLAELMDECFMQGLEPSDIQYAEEEVAPFAAALLASLRALFRGYQHALLEHGFTTPGFDAFRVLQRLDDAPPALFDGYSVHVAGFSALTGTEETLFRHLWERGATIWLHGDPALATEPATAHWSCALLAQWLARFGARCELACQPSGSAPNIHFFAGFDLHSQLASLQNDLHTTDTTEQSAGDTAIVLPHTDALLPVLHHLPDKNCNISMGYPLERSQLFQLLHTLMELRTLSDCATAPASAAPDAPLRLHWRPLLELLRHPLMRMLEREGQSLRPLFDRMERHLRQGARYANLDELTVVALGLTGPAPATPAQAALFDAVCANAIRNWQSVQTLADLGNALSALCETLLTSGNENGLWKRFPLDAESLFRVMQRVVPALRDSLLASTPLPWPLLRTVLNELLLAERVPFEADPLTGLQVLGMLETRLLRFRRVFLLDATDDRLPGVPSRSPLLPDSLRAVLGLPDTRRRDEVAAYTFHRLLAGADEAWLYWQEGIDPSSLFDGKKQRSRFIEALIWKHEQAQQKLCQPGVPPLRAASPHLVPPSLQRREVERTAAMDDRLREMLAKPLFATAVDAYLTCPLRFYYEYLCRLRPGDEVNEDDDPAAVGTVLHAALKRFYEPFVGRWVEQVELDPERLVALFRDEAEAAGLFASLPPESAAMLKVAGPERLTRFLRHQPARTHILHLEKRFETRLAVHGQTIPLAGILDRVDQRQNGAVVLDYKTGRLKTVPPAFWKADIWPLLAECAENSASNLFTRPEADPLPELARMLPSVQLPWYLYVYEQSRSPSDAPVADAAFVELAADGHEVPLFGFDEHHAPMGEANSPRSRKGDVVPLDEEGCNLSRNLVISQKIPVLLRFLASHMLACEVFRPRESRACDWCLWKNLCMV